MCNQNQKCGIITLIAFLLVALVCAALAIAILATQASMHAHGLHKDSLFDYHAPCSDESTLDVAIIGAGITGSYTAWRMRDKYKKIALFESSNRIGGRLYSYRLPNGLIADLGAMRFLERHVYLEQAARDLGLTIIPFPGDHRNIHGLHYYRRSRRRFNETATSSEFPYQVRPEESGKTTDQLRWKVFESSVDKSKQTTDELSDYVTRDGYTLKDLGRMSFYVDKLSMEAFHYVKANEGFDCWYTNQASAALEEPSDPGDSTQPSQDGRSQYLTVQEGFQQIPERMVLQFLSTRDTNNFLENHMLKSIRKNGDAIRLTFSKTVTKGFRTKEKSLKEEVSMCAKRVVLAIPPVALKKVDWEPLTKDSTTKYYLNSHKGIMSIKCYLSFNYPWWRNLPKETRNLRTDLPLRQTFEMLVRPDNASLLMATYSSDTSAGYWFGMLAGDQFKMTSPSTFNITQRIYDHLMLHISEALEIPKDSIPTPTGGVVQFWEPEHDGFAWYWIKPGFHWKDVMDHMLKPRSDYEVYIVSTYGPTFTSAWSNNGMELADSVLQKYFNMQPFIAG